MVSLKRTVSSDTWKKMTEVESALGTSSFDHSVFLEQFIVDQRNYIMRVNERLPVNEFVHPVCGKFIRGCVWSKEK